MGRFRSDSTGVVVSVDDSKDARFGAGWSSATEPKTATADKPQPAKK